MENSIQRIISDERVRLIANALGSDAHLHVVGGTVRDLFLKISLKDLDLACKFTPEEIIKRLEAKNIRTIPTGLKHQTVTAVPVPNAGNVEITTFRDKGMTPKGGVIASTSIEEDLRYRDFTINALAINVETGEILDLANGVSDITNKLLKAVGNPDKRFEEDPLRIMRLIRFYAQFGFSIETATYQSAKIRSKDLSIVSVERIREEFNKILLSDSPELGFELLRDFGILEAYLPEVFAYVNFEQNEFHKADLYHHTLEVITNTPKDLELRLSALFHDVGKPPTLTVDQNGSRHFYKHESVGAEMTSEILERLKYSNQVIKNVSTLVRTHMRPIDAGASGLRRLLRDTGELFPKWRKLKEADGLACKLEENVFKEQLTVFDEKIEEIVSEPSVHKLSNLAICGEDLIAIGMEPSPKMGEVLRALHEKVLDDPSLNTKEILIGLARKM
jgi:tRNA nucleotidyltransferase (CCA-adding enzyme)